MKAFYMWPYVKRHFASKGIADIVAIRKTVLYDFESSDPVITSEVVFIQCKYSKYGSARDALSDTDRKALINFSNDCGAVPVFAYNDSKRRLKLVNLLNGKEFIP